MCLSRSSFILARLEELSTRSAGFTSLQLHNRTLTCIVMPECSRVARQKQQGARLDPGGDTAEAGGGRGGRGGVLDSLHLKQVFLAMTTPRQVPRPLSSGQLHALMQHKQQAFILHQHRLKEFYRKQQQLNVQLLQQQPLKKSKELLAQQLALQQLLRIQQHLHQQQSARSSAGKR
ncbi:uncharacterized protein LOC144016628 [Festucalex cinctus]